jgi:hypothetical protein
MNKAFSDEKEHSKFGIIIILLVKMMASEILERYSSFPLHQHLLY